MSSSKEISKPVNSYIYDYQAGTSNWRRAVEDMRAGWARRKLWTDMALRAFKNKYRGAMFGAFWVTITTAMTATGLGVLYGYLFGRPLAIHLPYVTTAIIVWSLITGLANGGCAVFSGNAHIFKEFPLPLSLFSYRLAFNQLILLAYRSLVLVAVLLIFSTPLKPVALLAILGVILIVWIGFWMSMGLGVLSARYKDFGELVAAALTFIFFLTPIFWVPSRLGEYAFYINFNPFYHLIETVRGPILGHENLLLHFEITIVFAVLAPVFGWSIYSRLSHRLPYWC
jgi:homopolymeric O-antigen transport system permease protein